MTVVIFACRPVARASEDPDFFRASPTQIIYARTEPVQSSVGVMRSYVWDISVANLDQADYLFNHEPTTENSESWSDLVARKLTTAFDSVAATVLATRTDTSASIAMPLPRDPRKLLVLPQSDIAATVCRAHQKKPSLVLPAPYFEDVEYCVRLIRGSPNQRMVGVDAGKVFRLQAEANIALAKNAASGYRGPHTQEEIAAFQQLLIELATQIRVELKTSAEHLQWDVANRENNTFSIVDIDRWAGLGGAGNPTNQWPALGRSGHLSNLSNPNSRQLGSGNDLDFSRPSPNHIVFERTWEGRCPPGDECSAPARAYLFDVYINIADTIGRTGRDLEDRAARDILKVFGGIARTVLASWTDAIAIGWQDTEEKVCRAHQRKPSLVLPAPYFEDVEYCFSLISGEPPRKTFRLLGEVYPSLTKNSGSGYHDAETKEEIIPFTELLAKLATEIEVELEKSAKTGGWHVVENAFNTFTIDGLSK
jgi:hypothetical protein